MDIDTWREKANLVISEKVLVGKPFELKSLFEGCEWEALSKGERIVFGKCFANQVRGGHIPYVVAIERGKNNHSRYVKVAMNQ